MPKRNMLAAIFTPLVIGGVGLTSLMYRPEFASFRTVDVVQLLGSGMCFGAALCALFALLRSSRTD